MENQEDNYSRRYQERWKVIYKEWREHFPFLKPYGKSRLMYRTDIFLIGLFLNKSHFGELYDIQFEVKPLWDRLEEFGGDFDYCFQCPILENANNYHSKYLISFGPYKPKSSRDNHDIYFPMALESINEQFGKSLDGVAESGFLLEKCDLVFVNDPCRIFVNYHSLNRDKGDMLYEFHLALALYFKDMDRWNRIYSMMAKHVRGYERSLRWWNKPMNRWLQGIFKEKYSFLLKDTKHWIERKNKIDELLTDRDKFMALCEENSKLRKIRTLNKGELIYTPYQEPVRLKKRR